MCGMNNKILYIVIGVLVLVVIGGGVFFFMGNRDAQKENGVGEQTTNLPLGAEQKSEADTKMVDCGLATDPSCFVGRANSCLPVTIKMTGTDATTDINLTILGVENDKCHFQRKINGAINLNCYFPKGTDIMNAVDQTFGNDNGLKVVVDAACAGW